MNLFKGLLNFIIFFLNKNRLPNIRQVESSQAPPPKEETAPEISINQTTGHIELQEPEIEYDATTHLSKWVSRAECVFSETAERKGIRNIPIPEHWANMQLVVDQIYNPIREYFGVPIYINSFYRCQHLNNEVGGREGSQHTTGQAIDISVRGADFYVVWNGEKQLLTNRIIGQYIVENLDFDQLIYEFKKGDTFQWIHVSYYKDINKGQILEAFSDSGRTVYRRLKKESDDNR